MVLLSFVLANGSKRDPKRIPEEVKDGFEQYEENVNNLKQDEEKKVLTILQDFKSLPLP